MTRVSATKARGAFAEILNRAAYGKERVLLTRRGKTLAAVVSAEDVERLERLDDEADRAAARKALRETGRIPLSEVKAALGLSTRTRKSR